MSIRINKEKMMEKFRGMGRWLKKMPARLKVKVKDNLPQVIVASLILAFVIVYFWHSIFITIK